MRKVRFVNDNLYHVYNRGTEKRNIFLDNNDYRRFVGYLYELNDTDFINHLTRKIGRGPASTNINARDSLVNIIAFCLMPNHFHLILKQLRENGIPKFMQRLGTAYVMYFNKKNMRSGTLFQGKFKAIPIENDEYFTHLSRYIHINPVELIEPNWKVNGVGGWSRVNKFLENYRWSSYLDHIGIKNFPSVTNREIIDSYFENKQSYKNFINQWLNKDLEYIKDIILE